MITVFGSINVDLVTKTPRLPRPGETALGASYQVVAGGKGANQALAARRAGSKVRMVGAVGPDEFAQTALAELKAAGVDLSRVTRVEALTGCAFIAVDDKGENLIVVASGANRFVKASQLDDVTFTPSDSLVLQMEVGRDETFRLGQRAKGQGARVILSLAPFSPVTRAEIATASIIVVNEGEAADLAAHFGLAGDQPARRLSDALGLTVIATLGAKGAMAALADGTTLEVPSLKVAAVDTTGAGDTFTGAFAAALDQGLQMKAALRFGVVAAALSCTKLGAQPSIPWKDEIEKAL